MYDGEVDGLNACWLEERGNLGCGFDGFRSVLRVRINEEQGHVRFKYSDISQSHGYLR